MKTALSAMSLLISLMAYGQTYLTYYPTVDYSSHSFCRIARVIVGAHNTKVLVEVTGQKDGHNVVSFSKWTVLLPYESESTMAGLRSYDLEIPVIQSSDSTDQAIWRVLAERRNELQSDALEIYRDNLIMDLGSNALDTKYSIKSKRGEVFSFWLTFGKLPPGIEKVAIIELKEGGFEWSGIAINNPGNASIAPWNEASLKSEWEINGMHSIEGIYENMLREFNSPKYKLAVKYNAGADKYDIIYLSGAEKDDWKTGDIKAILTRTASLNIFKAKWYLSDKRPSEDLYISFEQGLMRVIWTNSNPEQVYLKLYPTVSDEIAHNSSQQKSSGTGFAISSNGYIVTNHHVTDGANSIKIRGVNGDFSKTYTAKVMIEDRNNDLSLLRIDDSSFSSFGPIPYVIRTSSSDVGSSVFVLGYPLRATMGDEVKVTNGIISSKSGFQGDVTSYQITAPVQPGNSGGPLFDEEGNVIGIINAKHSGAENVSYAVKSSYLMNLIDLLPTALKVETMSSISDKSLAEQVKILRRYTYIIEINQ
jgi:hypothetical protein